MQLTVTFSIVYIGNVFVFLDTFCLYLDRICDYLKGDLSGDSLDLRGWFCVAQIIFPAVAQILFPTDKMPKSAHDTSNII